MKAMKDLQFLHGIRDALPVCLGIIPVGISFGILALQAGLSAIQAESMSVLVMAGSSQLMAVGMVGQGAALISIVMAVFFLNLRHFVMSSSSMERVKDASLVKKLLCAFALCDESFALFSLSGTNSSDYLLGANTALYLAWVGSTVLGCVAQYLLPEIVAKSFSIAFYAAFFAMLVPKVTGNRRLLLLVLLSAGVNTLLRLVLPASWSVLLSMILCAWIGTYFCEEEDMQNA